MKLPLRNYKHWIFDANDNYVFDPDFNISEDQAKMIVDVFNSEVQALQKQVGELTKVIEDRGYAFQAAQTKTLLALEAEREKVKALRGAAKEIMGMLEEHGASIVPHLMDTDDNAGQRLRDLLSAHRTKDEIKHKPDCASLVAALNRFKCNCLDSKENDKGGE